MKFTSVIFLVVLACSSYGVVIRDDDRRLTGDRPYYPSQTEAYLDEDELARRRHRRRKRPCASSKVEPLGSDKTLINLYYSDVDYAGATNNYLSYGCGSGLGQGLQSDSVSSDAYQPAKPGIWSMLLSNVLFGNNANNPNNANYASNSQPLVSEPVVASGGPLGGSVPDEIKYTNYNQGFNPRRAYRQFNRELDRFLRPFYRLF